jgi:hypothetical protein
LPRRSLAGAAANALKRSLAGNWALWVTPPFKGVHERAWNELRWKVCCILQAFNLFDSAS